MDNKQNQPNSGQPSSSPANAANKPAAQPITSTSSTSATASGSATTSDASRRNQQAPTAGSASTSTDSRTTDTSRATSGNTGTDAARKSWLDQDKWAKSLNDLPQSLKEFGTKALDQVNSLSPTQKVVGGALLVSGLSWLALRGKSSKTSVAGGSRYTPSGDSKWKSSSQSVYRGSTTGQHNRDLETDSF